MSYTVREFTGDYPDRQSQANEWGADVYVEFHLNAKEYDPAGTADNYAMAIVAHNASEKSKGIARTFAAKVSADFGVPNGGVVQRKFRERGDYNLRFTDMPAVLIEPLWVSEIEHAKLAKTEAGQRRVARVVADTIRDHFPNGAKVAFSLGHAGKESKQWDRGAVSVLGDSEASLCRPMLDFATEMLGTDTLAPPTERDTSPGLQLEEPASMDTEAEDVLDSVINRLIDKHTETFRDALKASAHAILDDLQNEVLESRELVKDLGSRVEQLEEWRRSHDRK